MGKRWRRCAASSPSLARLVTRSSGFAGQAVGIKEVEKGFGWSTLWSTTPATSTWRKKLCSLSTTLLILTCYQCSWYVLLRMCPGWTQGLWSGRWESNPRPKLGKLLYCHCTTPALLSFFLIIHKYATGGTDGPFSIFFNSILEKAACKLESKPVAAVMGRISFPSGMPERRRNIDLRWEPKRAHDPSWRRVLRSTNCETLF
jgi:hypothetical protein